MCLPVSVSHSEKREGRIAGPEGGSIERLFPPALFSCMLTLCDRFAIISIIAALAVSCAHGAQVAVKPFGCDRTAEIDVRYDGAEQLYTLTSRGADTVEYALDLDEPEVASGMLRVSVSLNGREAFPVLAKAGARYRSQADEIHEPEDYAPSAGAMIVEHGIEGKAVVVRYRERPGSHDLVKTYRLSLEGMTLVVGFSSDAQWGLDGYAGVSLGRTEGVPGARVVEFPYLPEPVALLPDGAVMTAYVDPLASSSVRMVSTKGVEADDTLFVHTRTTAEPDTAGAAVPLSETAYVTVSEDLRDVLPRIVGPESPYRPALSSKLILDVWSHHRNFTSWGEGVALSWHSTESGKAHLSVRYADANPACGDGVALIIRHNDAILDRLAVVNGDAIEKVWERNVTLAVGDIVRCEIDRAGSHSCDSTTLVVAIDTPGGLYRSDADFSSSQGHRGFFYLEYADGVDTEMTWDPSTDRWTGAGDYSLFWRGGAHPGRSTTGAFDARAMINRYLEYGLTELAIIFHVWQGWGYDQGLPDHHPAHPDMGTASDIAAFVAAARDAGMLISLHENYTDMYPDNPPDYPSPLWDSSAIALDRYGAQKTGWYQPHTHQQAFQIAADRMRDLAEAESGRMAADYKPNAAYLDVTTGYRPDWTIDHREGNEAGPCLAHASARVLELFQAMKEIHGGPLFGEGGGGVNRFDSHFAGFVDAVERQIDLRSRAYVLPLFELLAVKPRMFNHGMGYYSRYFFDAGQKTPAIEEADLDQYRASGIAFGHAGFLGGSISGVGNWFHLHAPEYWLMQALQSRYADAAIAEVAYFDGETFRDTESALRARLPLACARLRLAYANGLVVYVNRDAADSRTSSIQDFSYEQGGGGWGYYEETGDGLVPLSWNIATQRWEGGRRYSVLHRYGGHPDGGAVVRTFTVPVTAQLTLRGRVEDADLNCGDGALAEISRNGELLWRCSLPGDVEEPCEPFELAVDAEAGDVIAFRIDEKAGNQCDSTLFTATISWDDGRDHDWNIDASGGLRKLPPSGFFAHDSSGFMAYTARLGNQSGAPIVDYVSSPEYRFARSRDGRPAVIEEFSTDGGIAVVYARDGVELHSLGLTEASLSGQLLVRSSARCDINLRYRESDCALVTIRDLESGAAADVTWGAVPEWWRDALQAHGGHLELRIADREGNPAGELLPVQYDLDGNTVLSELMEGVTYAVTLIRDATFFIRGDANADGGIDLGDAVAVLGYLFSGAGDAGCRKALDSGDNGTVDISDAVYLLGYLFSGAPPPPSPFQWCGSDPTADALECTSFDPCE